jgi:hypothetical protein
MRARNKFENEGLLVEGLLGGAEKKLKNQLNQKD